MFILKLRKWDESRWWCLLRTPVGLVEGYYELSLSLSVPSPLSLFPPCQVHNMMIIIFQYIFFTIVCFAPKQQGQVITHWKHEPKTFLKLIVLSSLSKPLNPVCTSHLRIILYKHYDNNLHVLSLHYIVYTY